MKKLLGLFLFLSVSSAVCQSANATVTISGTRVLYDGGKKEVSITVKNPDKTPYLIQSSIDNLEKSANKPPFIITPPLYRLDGGKENRMRIIFAGSLPQDKESMYWLRIKAIPSAAREKNTLQIAVSTSIKLIYRPEALKKVNVEQESNKLTWRITGNMLEVINPTPCFINFNEILVGGKKLANVSYAAPGATTRFALPEAVSGGNVQFSIISDFGAVGKLHSSST